MSPLFTRRLIEQYLRTGRPGAEPVPPAGPVRPELTQPEAGVLQAVARGLSNMEIAADLYVSYSTVKTHVSHLLTKPDARDRAQLVMIAYQSGLARP